MLLGQFGAPIPPRPKVSDIGPVGKMGTFPFAAGPRLQIGPFGFAQTDRPQNLVITVKLLQLRQQRFKNAGIGEDPWVLWLANHQAKATRDYNCCFRGQCYFSGNSSDFYRETFGADLKGEKQCQRSMNGWGFDRDVAILFSMGIWPIARFEHPMTKQRWGVYVQWKADRIIVSIRPWSQPGVVRGLLNELWDLLGDIAAFVVDTVEDLWNWLDDIFEQLACALAKPVMQKLGGWLQGDVAAVPASAKAAGVTDQMLASLKANPTYEGASLIGELVQNYFCAATKKYPAGTITTFDAKLQRWRIAIPKGAKMPTASKLSGQIVETSRPYTETAASGPKPQKLVEVSAQDFERALKPPWYKRPSTYVVGGVGVAAAVGGVLLWTR